MKVYTYEDIDARVVINGAIEGIVSQMKDAFGNSYNVSHYNNMKDKITEISSNELQGLLSEFVGKMDKGKKIGVKEGEANRVLSLLMMNNFYVAGSLWSPLIKKLFGAGDEIEDGAELIEKANEDRKKHMKEVTGGNCNEKELGEAILDPEGEKMRKCFPTGGNKGDGEGGDGEGEGGGGDGTGTRPEDPDANARWDPLALDLNHNGKIDTTALSAGEVFFDIDENDGGIREHMGWLGEGDGFLVQDLNNNGNIDGISELFGNFTTNAFDDLKARIDSNNDGIIDANDDLFHTLQVWIDKNGNGTTEEGELYSLESLGITSIDTNKTLHTIWDGTNNIVNSTSTYTQDGEQQLAGGMNFEVDQTVTKSSGTIYVTDLSQPILRGFGDVKDSIVVMHENPDFRSLIKEMAAGDDAFIKSKFDKLLALWTGLDSKYKELGITKDFDAPLTNADKLWIMEKITGRYVFTAYIEEQRFLNCDTVYAEDGIGSFPLRNWDAKSYSTTLEQFYSAFIFQTAGFQGAYYTTDKDKIVIHDEALFRKEFTEYFISKSSTFEGGLEVAKLMNIFGLSPYHIDSDAIASSPTVNEFIKLLISGSVGSFINHSRTVDFTKILNMSDPDLFSKLDLSNNTVIIGSNGNDTFSRSGMGFYNYLYAGAGDDTINTVISRLSRNGNIFGEINTGAGNDNFTGSIDGGKLYMGTGDDTLSMEHGMRNGFVDLGEGNDTLDTAHMVFSEIQGSGDNTVNIQSIDRSSISLSSGDDKINIAQNTMYGNISTGAGNDIVELGGNLAWSDVTLGSGDDHFIINGGLQDTSVKGGDGNDTFDITQIGPYSSFDLIGGKGNDIFNVQAGALTNIANYTYKRGDGQDIITTSYISDVIKFGSGITKDDLLVIKEGNDLIIGLKDGNKTINQLSDTIRINGMFSESDGKHFIEQVNFHDGTSLSLSSLLDLIEGGIEGDFTLSQIENLKLNFSDSDNSLSLEYLNNCEFNTGGGNDTITTGKNYSSNYITINMGDGNDIANLKNIYRSNIDMGAGDDTVIVYDSVSDDIIIDGGQGNDVFQLKTYSFRGLYKGGEGDDKFTFEKDPTSPYGNDFCGDGKKRGASVKKIEGGKGNDNIELGGNSIDFIFNRGDGKDIIRESGYQSSISFGEGISAEDVSITKLGDNLIISLSEDDVMIFENYFGLRTTRSYMDKIFFADGSEIEMWSIVSKFEAGYNDTYSFNKGDGEYRISDAGGTDKLIFGEGITLADIEVKVEGGSLIIAIREDGKTFNELTDKITISNYHYYGSKLSVGTIESLQFADGTLADIASTISRAGTDGDDSLSWIPGKVDVNMGDGNDYVNAGDFDNVIAGGKGNDNLNGGAGNDTYVFNRGDGIDSISDNSGTDKIVFGEGITLSDIVVNVEGTSLIIGIFELGKTFNELKDKITISNYHSYGNSLSSGAIESLEFTDGTVADIASIISRVGSSKDDSLSWTLSRVDVNMETGDDYVNSGDFDDVLIGGKGNDRLNGGGGDDTYLFNRGDGIDTIYDTSGNDIIRFGAGITLSNIVVKTEGSSLIIAIHEDGKTFDELTDKITISSYHNYGSSLSSGVIESVEFADGTVANIDSIISRAGSDADDSLSWKLTKVDVNMGDGNDYVNSGDFDDVIQGGKGNDNLNGGGGNDTYIFNRGDGIDSISDESGTDKIVLNNVNADEFGIYSSGYQLQISYGAGDNISFSNNSIERFEFEDGSYLTNDDVNYLIQQISAFSRDNGVSFSNADDVRMNEQFNQLVTGRLQRD